MATSNHIASVAIVGAGGNIGRFITEALLKTGQHTITAISRLDSQSDLPPGVIPKKVDYNSSKSLVEALKGQDALVITLSGRSPTETEMNLINAAGEAGVPWILPNDWGHDTANEAFVQDVAVLKPKVSVRKAIEDLGKSCYVSMCTGFWYEWGLAMPEAFGLDFANRTATLFDKGETKVSTSTRHQVGRAVAALLNLPISPEGSNEEACLEHWKNQVVYMSSFTISQKDMLESTLRVTGNSRDDWTITREPAQERFSSGVKELHAGKHTGFPKIMARIFYPDGCGDFEHNKGTLNKILGLPTEDIDDATMAAIERAKATNMTD